MRYFIDFSNIQEAKVELRWWHLDLTPSKKGLVRGYLALWVVVTFYICVLLELFWLSLANSSSLQFPVNNALYKSLPPQMTVWFLLPDWTWNNTELLPGMVPEDRPAKMAFWESPYNEVTEEEKPWAWHRDRSSQYASTIWKEQLQHCSPTQG